MNRLFLKGMGAAAGVLALAACNPYPADPGITISIDNPTDAQTGVPLSFTSNVTIDGDFTLGAPGCDPTAISVDEAHGVIHPEWDPYACTGVAEDGSVPQDQGNIQYFVDGIFMTYSESEAVAVDLSPKLEYALYDYAYDDAGEPIDFNQNDTVDDDVFYYCSFWLPADNLGYAEALYDTFSNASYEDLYGYPLLDISFDQDAYDPEDPTTYPEALATQPGGTYELFGYGFYYENFDYMGTNGSGYGDDGSYDEASAQHIFYAELHGNNHSPIYGVNRPRVVTGAFDLSSMPDNWCGNVLGVGSPYYL